MKSTVFLFAIALLGLTSCEDIFNEDTTKPDGSVPYIKSEAPMQQASYLNNENIAVKGFVSDKDLVHVLEVHVTKTDNLEASTAEVFGYTAEPKARGIKIDTSFSAAGLTPGMYQLVITAIDGRTNKAVTTTNFTVNNN